MAKIILGLFLALTSALAANGEDDGKPLPTHPYFQDVDTSEVACASASPEAPAPPDHVTFELDWKCAQTYETTMPSRAKVKIHFNPNDGTADLTAIDNLIKLARCGQNIAYDFFSCAQDMISQVPEKLDAYCSAKQCDRDAEQPKFDAVIKSSQNLVRIYGKYSYEVAALSPFEPGNLSYPRLDDKQVNAYVEILSQTCSTEDLGDWVFDRKVIAALGNVKNKLSENCLARIARSFSESLKRLEIDSETFCDSFEKYDTCNYRKNSIVRTLAMLSQQGILPEALVETPYAFDADGVCSISWSLVDDTVRSSFIDANTIKQIESCSDLQAGEEKAVTGRQLTSQTSNYRLKRLADRTLDEDYSPDKGVTIGKGSTVQAYNAIVDIDFDAGDPDKNIAFRKRVQECYDEVEPKLRGPKGEFLKITLADLPSDPTQPRPNRIRVGIVPDGSRDRESIYHWSESISCPLIMHETTHYLGLNEEYIEKHIGAELKDDKIVYRSYERAEDVDNPTYDCRVAGPADSLMNDQDLAFIAAGLKNPFSSIATTLTSPKTSVFDYISGSLSRASLYYPTEFMAITQPGCREKNKLFYECMGDAGKTSRGHFGQGCTATKPEKCYKPAFDWVKKLQ